MFQPCSPICVTQPSWTSSISAGSTSLRSTSAFSTWPASSSPRICESVPFFLPIGERTASMISASGIGDSIDPPLAHALKRMLATVLEVDSRSGDEVAHGRGDEDLARPRKRRDARAGVDGDAGDLVAEQLAFARVEPGANVDPELAHRIANTDRASNRARRTVERREES